PRPQEGPWMTPFAVLADVHGNLSALEAVLGEIDRLGVPRIVCLGDVVGYGAEPNECVAALRARDAGCVAGNHDLIAIRALGFDRCGLAPAHALRRTRAALDDAS